MRKLNSAYRHNWRPKRRSWQSWPAPTQTFVVGLPLAFLIAFTTGCAPRSPQVLIQTHTEYVKLPSHYLDPTPIPTLRGPTEGDLISAYLERGAAIAQCNADKQALAELNSHGSEADE